VLPEADTFRANVCTPFEGRVTLVRFRVGIGPLGETVADKSTTPAKSLTLVTMIVDVFENPCTTLREDGLDVILNP